MGNVSNKENPNCKQRIDDIVDETKIQIERLNPFSQKSQQIPYAQPLQYNPYSPNQKTQKIFNDIICQQPIKVPAQFQKDQSYQYDEKYWKKQHPNVIIQGHWFKRKPHGLCKLFFPKGPKLFISYFNHGQPLFEDCLVIFQNGSYYHGSLRNFKFDGQGKYVHFDKSCIIYGSWKDGKPVGKIKQLMTYKDQIILFEGQFNENSQKQGQNCLYTISKLQNQNQKIFNYQGPFKKDQFFGQSKIHTNNGKTKLEGTFDNINVEVHNLESDKFIFKGKLEKTLLQGKGAVTMKRSQIKVTYQGEIKNGMLNGNGTVIDQNGEQQKVYWHNGIKLKHLRNFQNPLQLNELLNKIESYYLKSKTYSEMTKQLEQYYKQHQVNEVSSPKRLLSSFMFEMISKEKAKTISASFKQINENIPQGGSQKISTKKQLIIQLEKGRFLYVSCFNPERQ